MRPPPTSTLFPYTTLFRSFHNSFIFQTKNIQDAARMLTNEDLQRLQWDPETRSEEHTSELQSRFDIVCRLLLEKKKMVYFRTNFIRESNLFDSLLMLNSFV